MLAAVIADTHDRIPPHLPGLIEKADVIWHLGDVTSPGVLDEIEALGPPVKVVRGNCDYSSDWPLTLDFEAEARRIHMVHIPPRNAPPGVDLLLHGHTHVPRNEMVGTTRFLNPGCVTRPNRGAPASIAFLELRKDCPPDWRLHLL